MPPAYRSYQSKLKAVKQTPDLRNAFQAAVPKRHEFHGGPVCVRVVKTSPQPRGTAAAASAPAPTPTPMTTTAAPPATAGRAAPALQVRNEGPDVYVLDAASAEQAVLLAPLGAVRAGADDGGGAEPFELSVRVGVGADEPVQVDAAGIQARFLFVGGMV